jgi:hypothetical protein
MLRLSLNNAKGEMMSRKIMLSMLLLFSVFALSAVTLDGIVTGAESGEALPGADVELHFGGMEFYETSTDESGEFIFDEVEAGNYFLRVEAAGFVPYMEMLELNENMTITIALLPGNIPGELTGHLFGNVIYEDLYPGCSRRM